MNIDQKKIFAGEEWEIIRGSWFYDGSWIPLELEYTEVLEEAHLRMFQKHGLTQSTSTPDFGTPSHSYKGIFRT